MDLNQLDGLLDTDHAIIVFEGVDRETVVDAFTTLCKRSPRAVYRWSASRGLRRLTVEHIPIPQTVRPRDLLDYIRARRHYGVFILDELESLLDDPEVVDHIEHLVRDKGGGLHKLVFIGTGLVMPDTLEHYVYTVREW